MIHFPLSRTLIKPAILIAIAATIAYSQTPTPPSPNPALAPAVKLVREGETEKALELLKQAVKENKNDGEAWYYLGAAYLRLSDFNKAGEAFKKAVEMRPDLAAQAQAGYAYALVLRNRLDSATLQANKALAIDPQNVEALYTLGIVNLRKGQGEEAIKRADAIIALKPDFGPAYLLKSQAFVSYPPGAVYRNSNPSKNDRTLNFKAAAEALEKYLELETDPRAADPWKEQLKTLKFYVNPEGLGSKIYTGREVTTRARLISKPEPVYTQVARAEQTSGTVVLRCVFAADGTVQHILVIRALPNGLTQQSIAAAKRIKFIPAMLDGKPVSMWMQLEYNYNVY